MSNHDNERQLLLEVARLYAALTQVLRTQDLDALHVELADLLADPPTIRRKHPMFTRAFWLATAERALKSAGQFGLAVIGQDLVGVDAFQANAGNVAVAAATGAVFSILTSLASANIGVHGSPSLAPAAEAEAAHDPLTLTP